MEHNSSINSPQKKLSFEETWAIIQEEAINKIIDSLETGLDGQKLFTSEQHMHIYTIVFNICASYDKKSDGPRRLYDNYKKTLEDYISAKVLPALRGKTNEVLLQELVKQWDNQKMLTSYFSKFFNYLDRYFIERRRLPSVKATSYLIFYKLVYGEISDQIRGVVLSLISKECEGIEIDQALVKNVLDIYIEMGEGSAEYYEKDFGAMIDDTSSFSSGEAKDCRAPMMNLNDYMKKKVEECPPKKKNRRTNLNNTIFQRLEFGEGSNQEKYRMFASLSDRLREWQAYGPRVLRDDPDNDCYKCQNARPELSMGERNEQKEEATSEPETEINK